MLSITEENYIKALYRLTCENGIQSETGTNELAAHLNVKPATATDMLKKLKEKKLVEYERYGKSSLSKKGLKVATDIVRKHRLWETFLFDKLGFTWDEVHEVAEQLEHIQSPKLVERLNRFLNYPAVDPHGDLIPQDDKMITQQVRKTLNEAAEGETYLIIGVNNNTSEFLQYMDKMGLALNKQLRVIARQPFDEMIEIECNGLKAHLTPKVAREIVISAQPLKKKST